MSARCERPLKLAALVDYWFGDGDACGDEAIEEHFFACEACSRRLHGVVALGEGVRRLAHQGAVEMVVTPSFLEKAWKGYTPASTACRRACGWTAR